MAVSSINGVGRTYLGKRDFDADGTYTTTKWLIVLYFPIVPSASIRVNSEDEIIEVIPICSRQVLYVYSYVYVLAPLLIAMADKYHWKNPTAFCVFALFVALPAILRFFAKQRA